MNKEIEIGKRIRECRENKGITQEELGIALGLNKSTIQRYESGKIVRIKLPVLEAIAAELNVNPEYLALKTDDQIDYDDDILIAEIPEEILRHFNGDVKSAYKAWKSRTEPEYFNGTKNLTEKYPQLHSLPPMRKIPLLGAVACGEPIYREEDEWISLPTDINADFCLRCVGDSMINARINDGDIVFIKACPEVENGQIAAVSIDNEVTLKRVYYYPEKNKLILNPENPAYEPFVYTKEELNDIRILGKAVVFLSKVK